MKNDEGCSGELRRKRVAIFCFVVFLCCFWSTGWCAKIVYPWRATTAIVKTNEAFEVWFSADSGQTVQSVQLRSAYKTVTASVKTNSTTSWVYDQTSGNTCNRRYSVKVPAGTPADRYDLVLKTSKGDQVSTAAVKVIKDYKSIYHILHISDFHFGDGVVEADLLLQKRLSAIADMANIIDPELVFVTGDNLRYTTSQYLNRIRQVFDGEVSAGLKGLFDFNAATFVSIGNHDFEQDGDSWSGNYSRKANYWNQNFGLQTNFFKYGNGRYLMINDGWDGFNYLPQQVAGSAWLTTAGAGGNFTTAFYHKKESGLMGGWANTAGIDLLLYGHDHHKGKENPVVIDNRYIGYCAMALENYCEFGLFRVDNSAGGFTPFGATNAVAGTAGYGMRTGQCKVLQNDSNKNNPDMSTWVYNLTLNYANGNDGRSNTETATFSNRFDFAIAGARARFVLPRGYSYDVSAGTIVQAFDGDQYHVVDLRIDLPAFSTTTVRISGTPNLTLPVVGFIAPANLTVQQGTNLYVNVSAADPDGISRVYLSKNGVPLARSEGGAPYEWNAVGQTDPELMNLQPGTFTLTAKAADTVGSYTGKTITITVLPANLPPYFTADPFSKPDANVGVAYSQSFSAMAIDPEGGTKTFSKVAGPEWLSVTTAGNAQGTPGSADAGTNSFILKVTDNGELSDTATLKINVLGGVTIPVVYFIAPTNVTLTAGSTLYVNVGATDPDGISRVRLYKNGVELARSEGGAPYEWNGAGQSDPELQNLQSGSFVLTAKVTDTVGSVGEKSVTINVVAPQTVSFTSVAAEDGYVMESSETSMIGGSIAATGTAGAALRIGDTTQKQQIKSIVSFDTSALPDGAVILSATLKLRRGSISGTVTNLGQIKIDIKGGTGFNGSTVLQKEDFQAVADATGVATMSYPSANGTLSTGVLSATGLTKVNKTGKTQLKVYFATDDDNDAVSDYLGFYSGENAIATNRPVLEVSCQ